MECFFFGGNFGFRFQERGSFDFSIGLFVFEKGTFSMIFFSTRGVFQTEEAFPFKNVFGVELVFLLLIFQSP